MLAPNEQRNEYLSLANSIDAGTKSDPAARTVVSLGRELVHHLLSDRPLLFVTGHFGNWEMAGYTLGLLGFRTHAIARPLDNPYLDDFLRQLLYDTNSSDAHSIFVFTRPHEGEAGFDHLRFDKLGPRAQAGRAVAAAWYFSLRYKSPGKKRRGSISHSEVSAVTSGLESGLKARAPSPESAPVELNRMAFCPCLNS